MEEQGTNQGELDLYTDGASRGNPGPSAGAYLLVDRTGKLVRMSGFFLGAGTNNEAEYRALIRGLEAAAGLGARKVIVYSDSELVVRQMSGRYRVGSPRLRPLNEQAKALAGKFDSVRFRSVPREDPMIARADLLCNQVLDKEAGRG